MDVLGHSDLEFKNKRLKDLWGGVHIPHDHSLVVLLRQGDNPPETRVHPDSLSRVHTCTGSPRP